jgi:hypothetical protein
VARGKVAVVRIGVVALGFVLLASGCAAGAGSPAKSGNDLRVTRDDGSRVKFSDDLHAFCARASNYEGSGKPGPVELWVVAGELPPEEENRKPTTFWVFSRPTGEIKRAPKVRLPDEGLGGASLFVYDADTEAEFSSHEERAKGWVEVQEWGCEKGDQVRISVDATLEDEYFQGPLAEAEGAVETVIGDPLPIPD